MFRLGKQTAPLFAPRLWASVKANPRWASRSRLGVWMNGLPSAAIVSARWSSVSRNSTFGFDDSSPPSAAKAGRPAARRTSAGAANRNIGSVPSGGGGFLGCPARPVPVQPRRRPVFALTLIACVPCWAGPAGDQEATDDPAPLIRPGDTVALIGGGVWEAERRSGDFETALTLAVPDVTVRHLGWPGDTADQAARRYFGTPEDGREHLLRHVDLVKPTVILVAYGGAESLPGGDGRGGVQDAPRFAAGGAEGAGGAGRARPADPRGGRGRTRRPSATSPRRGDCA